jgi:hypothetical protein
LREKLPLRKRTPFSCPIYWAIAPKLLNKQKQLDAIAMTSVGQMLFQKEGIPSTMGIKWINTPPMDKD